MYFKCLNHLCGATFDTPATTIVNLHEYWGSPTPEVASCCPICHDTDIEEVLEGDNTDDTRNE